MMGVSMYHVFQHVITRYHMNLKDRWKLPMSEYLYAVVLQITDTASDTQKVEGYLK